MFPLPGDDTFKPLLNRADVQALNSTALPSHPPELKAGPNLY